MVSVRSSAVGRASRTLAGSRRHSVTASGGADAAQCDLYRDVVAVDGPRNVEMLVSALREIRAEEDAAELAGRLAAQGQFSSFLRLVKNEERYRFGREPDGSPTPPWGWDELS